MFRRYSLLAALPILLGAVVVLAGCPDKKPKYPACDKDGDCKEGQVCVNKKCVECGKNSDCEDGQVCQDGACIAEDAECRSDDECEDGQVCKKGKCEACETNAECGPGGKCNKGVCDRPKACEVDEDCADDEDCIDGRCLKPWKSEGPGGDACQLVVIPFDYDQWTIREDVRNNLAILAECLQKLKGNTGIYIEGHADENGTEEYNIALSERRARAVADYLARLGVDPARFNIVPKGESEPTGEGEAADRRVEFEWR